MKDYRKLTKPQQRALDRFARSHAPRDPLSRWPELNSAALDQIVALGLVEQSGADDRGERLYRVTDDGNRVHEDMWRDGKVPHHPASTGPAEDE